MYRVETLPEIQYIAVTDGVSTEGNIFTELRTQKYKEIRLIRYGITRRKCAVARSALYTENRTDKTKFWRKFQYYLERT